MGIAHAAGGKAPMHLLLAPVQAHAARMRTSQSPLNFAPMQMLTVCVGIVVPPPPTVHAAGGKVRALAVEGRANHGVGVPLQNARAQRPIRAFVCILAHLQVSSHGSTERAQHL